MSDDRRLLVIKIENSGVLKTPNIKQALLSVDRRDFVLPQYEGYAYDDRPLPIGEGQTISQPFTVVFMLELLQAQEGHKVLDAGSGSGWTTALLSKIVGPKGKIIAMEIVHSLKTFGESNFKKIEEENAIFVHGDASRGYPKEAPYDRILVSASASEIPKELLNQLKVGGKLVIPLRDYRGSMVLVEKNGENKYKKSEYPGFAFVPFIQSRDNE